MCSCVMEAQRATQIPCKNTHTHTPRLRELVRKARANLQVTSQEPNGDCSGKHFQIILFFVGGGGGGSFRADFPPVM